MATLSTRRQLRDAKTLDRYQQSRTQEYMRDTLWNTINAQIQALREAGVPEAELPVVNRTSSPTDIRAAQVKLNGLNARYQPIKPASSPTSAPATTAQARAASSPSSGTNVPRGTGRLNDLELTKPSNTPVSVPASTDPNFTDYGTPKSVLQNPKMELTGAPEDQLPMNNRGDSRPASDFVGRQEIVSPTQAPDPIPQAQAQNLYPTDAAGIPTNAVLTPSGYQVPALNPDGTPKMDWSGKPLYLGFDPMAKLRREQALADQAKPAIRREGVRVDFDSQGYRDDGTYREGMNKIRIGDPGVIREHNPMQDTEFQRSKVLPSDYALPADTNRAVRINPKYVGKNETGIAYASPNAPTTPAIVTETGVVHAPSTGKPTPAGMTPAGSSTGDAYQQAPRTPVPQPATAPVTANAGKPSMGTVQPKPAMTMYGANGGSVGEGPFAGSVATALPKGSQLTPTTGVKTPDEELAAAQAALSTARANAAAEAASQKEAEDQAGYDAAKRKKAADLRRQAAGVGGPSIGIPDNPMMPLTTW